jgi:DNA-binding transcriptional MerR regulator
MTSIQNLTIQEAAESTGLSVHTLRYYERIGLLIPVERAANGHRRYDQSDLDRVTLINRLRLTGMPLDQIKRYTDALALGDATIPERIELLEAQRQAVLQQINTLTEMLGWIEYKLGTYQEKEHK